MPPKRASKKAAPASSRALRMLDTDEEGEVDMAQELRVMEENLRRIPISTIFNTADLERLLTITKQAGVRKEQKQKHLEKEFDSEVTRIKAQIDQKVREYQENMRRNQDAYLDRLTTLVQRKAEVERQIVQHTRELAKHCMATTEEFEAVVKGRSDDVDGAMVDLKNAAVDDEDAEQQARDSSS